MYKDDASRAGVCVLAGVEKVFHTDFEKNQENIKKNDQTICNPKKAWYIIYRVRGKGINKAS